MNFNVLETELYTAFAPSVPQCVGLETSILDLPLFLRLLSTYHPVRVVQGLAYTMVHARQKEEEL